MTAPRAEKDENDLFESPYPSEATIGDQSYRAAAVFPKTRFPPPPQLVPPDPAVRERIAKRAYELYVRRGRAPRHEVDDWLKAEQMVLGELGLRAFRKRVKVAREGKIKRREKP